MNDDDTSVSSRSDAAWFHGAVRAVRAARDSGDTELAQQLRASVRDKSEAMGNLLDAVITAADDIAAGVVDTEPRKIGLNQPGQLLCDFCADEHCVAYYPFTEFAIPYPNGQWNSGDKWYVCGRCLFYVESDDLPGLRAWVGATADEPHTKHLWYQFRRNRTGPGVLLTTDTDPGGPRDAAP